MSQKQKIEGITFLGNQDTDYTFDYNPNLLQRFESSCEGPVVVNLDCFEFASRCPITDQPDFASIHISYIPKKYMVESKSLKLYLFSFQQHGDFHEKCIDLIKSDLVKLLDPLYLEVYGDFNSRGGICILPFSTYATEEYKEFENQRWLDTMRDNLKHCKR